MVTSSCRASVAILLIFSYAVVFTGCQQKSGEPQATGDPQVAVEEDQQQIPGGEIGGVLGVVLDGQRFPIDGETETWKVTHEDIQNVLVHDTKKNEDGTLTADVSFESMRDGNGIAVDTLITYEVQIVSIANGAGKVATHKAKKLQPKSIEKIGGWAKK